MLKDIAPKATGDTTRKARKLRREMSLPEVLLWRLLRNADPKIKFRRQHPSGPYILDFFCSDARLAIEIDGASHDSRRASDERRDAWLATHGIETLRLPASAVLADVLSVAESIRAACLARLPLHHPASPDGPPPRDKLGED